jgi:hypothetical protein
LEDATKERHPPNATRTKHVPQTVDSAPFGDAAGDALIVGSKRDNDLKSVYFVSQIDSLVIKCRVTNSEQFRFSTK